MSPEWIKVAGEIGAAFIAALVAVTGWYKAHSLATQREDRTKRLQITLDHCEKQISELYSPLLGLLTQLDTVATILINAVEGDPINTRMLQTVTYETYFLPLHTEVRKILTEKLHLFEGYKIPPSVTLYFQHFTSENLYWLMVQKQSQNIQIKITDFPEELYKQIKASLETVAKRYEDTIYELQHGVRPKA